MPMSSTLYLDHLHGCRAQNVWTGCGSSRSPLGAGSSRRMTRNHVTWLEPKRKKFHIRYLVKIGVTRGNIVTSRGAGVGCAERPRAGRGWAERAGPGGAGRFGLGWRWGWSGGGRPREANQVTELTP